METVVEIFSENKSALVVSRPGTFLEKRNGLIVEPAISGRSILMKAGALPIPEFIRGDMRVLIIAMMFAVGSFWTVPAQAQISDTQVAALVEALRLSAPDTGNPNDGLYSDWKIKWENIIRWSKRCTGTEMEPAEFEANTQKARRSLPASWAKYCVSSMRSAKMSP